MGQELVHLGTSLLSQPRWATFTSAIILLVGVSTTRWILATLRPRDFPPGPPVTPGLGNLLQIPLVKPYLRFQQWSTEYAAAATTSSPASASASADLETLAPKRGRRAELIGLKLATANMVILSSARVVHELLDKRGDRYSDRLDMWILDNHILHRPEEKGRLIVGYTEPFRKWRRSWMHVLAGSSVRKLHPLFEAEAAELCLRLCATTSPPENDDENDDDERKKKKKGEEKKTNSSGASNSHNNALLETLVRRWALAPPLLMTSGQRLRDLPDSWVDDFYHAQDLFVSMILPGNTPPVDILPVLRYVPEFLAKWKTDAREARRVFLRDAYGHLAAAQEHISRRRLGRRKSDEDEEDGGNGHEEDLRRTFAGLDCLIGKALREREDGTSDKRPEHQTDQYLAFQNSGFLAAAADTVVATLNALLLVFAAYPAVQERARQEVDRVCRRRDGEGQGPGLPPRADMLGEFVYLRACMSELLRWRPTTPGAIPHTLSQDDTFEGYVFPKGTTFIIDAWTIGHDEEMYDRPDDFIPERFLENPLGVRPELYPSFAPSCATEDSEESGRYRRPVYTFGAGRRQCPGEQFAYTYITLTLAKLLWAFDISPAAEEAIDLSIETGFVDGVVTRPASMPVVLEVRSEERRRAVIEDAERTRAVAEGMMG